MYSALMSLYSMKATASGLFKYDRGKRWNAMVLTCSRVNCFDISVKIEI